VHSGCPWLRLVSRVIWGGLGASPSGRCAPSIDPPSSMLGKGEWLVGMGEVSFVWRGSSGVTRGVKIDWGEALLVS
jgi:hypothetical protein